MVRVLERSQRLGYEAYVVVRSVANATLTKVASVWNSTKEAFNAKFPKAGAKIYSITSAFNQAMGSLIGKVSGLYNRVFPGRGYLRVEGNQPPVRENLAPPVVDRKDLEMRALILSLLPSGENLTEPELVKAVKWYKKCAADIHKKNYNEARTADLKNQAAKAAALNRIRERTNLV